SSYMPDCPGWSYLSSGFRSWAIGVSSFRGSLQGALTIVPRINGATHYETAKCVRRVGFFLRPLVRHDGHQMRIPIAVLSPVVGLATILTSCTGPADHASKPVLSIPVATAPVQRLSQPQQKAVAAPVDPDRRVGAIFINNGPLHVCTGSVVHS